MPLSNNENGSPYTPSPGLSGSPCDMHLHAEIEELRQALSLREQHIVALETACLRETDRLAELESSVGAWQDKYDRLYDSHKRIQKVNQNLEDKLLRQVDRDAVERSQLTNDVATLSVRLAQANYTTTSLERDLERYKNDIRLAIQLIQCKPDGFMPQKLSSLPIEVQSKVASYMRLDEEGSIPGSPVLHNGPYLGLDAHNPYKVVPSKESPIALCPFPPTAMVYSMRGGYEQDIDSSPNDDVNVPASLVAKILEDGLKSTGKHCETCKCSATEDLTKQTSHYSVATQTMIQEELKELCSRCSIFLNNSRSNSPFAVKISRNNESITKSDTSPTLRNEKSNIMILKQSNDSNNDLIKFDAAAPAELDHRRLCDKTNTSEYSIINETKSRTLSTYGKTGSRSESDNSKFNNINSIKGNGDQNFVINDIDSDKLNLNHVNDRVSQSRISSSNESTNKSKTNAKLFEHFNRNMIQTLKTDNPNAGPRLCSLRIQNGSSNILLDNAESNVSPILYTRRHDLENGDMFSDVLNDAQVKLQNEIKPNKRLLEEPEIEKITTNKNVHEINVKNKANNIVNNVNNKNIEQYKENEYNISWKAQVETQNNTVASTQTSHNTQNVSMENKKIPAISRVIQTDSSSCDNTKDSYTQSSSISSGELRESAQLLRQQLNRVAEWVHTNSKINYSQSSDYSDTNSSKNNKLNQKRYSQGYVSGHNSDESKLNVVEIPVINTNGKLSSGDSLSCKDDPKIMNKSELEQMEYNVKQFLLKQNEWSVPHATNI